MHKGVILLMQAEDKTDAISQAQSFMEDYYEQVYDWYGIGGRRSGLLTGIDEDESGNVMQVKDCLQIVKDFAMDIEGETEQARNKMIENKDNGTMGAYYAGIYHNLAYKKFCFDSCVYDTQDEYEIDKSQVENFTDYYAVVIDMHN